MTPSSPRRILSILSLITLVVMIGIGIVVPMLPTYALSLGASATQVGLIFAGFSFARTLCNPFIGALADRTELKRLMLIGLLSYGLLSLAYIVSTSPGHLILVRTLHGLASTFVIPLAMSYAAIIAEDGQEGVFMGSINMALFLGMGAGPLIGGALTDAVGPNAAFYTLAGLSSLALLLTMALLPPMHRRKAKEEEATLRGILRIPSLLGLLLFRIISALGSGNLMAFIPIMANRAGLSHTAIGILISSNIFITGLLQRPFGRMVTKENTIQLILAGSFISAIALASLPLGSGLVSYLVIGGIMGFGGAVSMPAASVMVMEHGRNLGMSSTMGIFDSAMGIGMIVGPLISGLVMELLGISWVFYVGGLFSLAGMGVFYVLARTPVSQSATPSEP